jgi:hypothetical protein
MDLTIDLLLLDVPEVKPLLVVDDPLAVLGNKSVS